MSIASKINLPNQESPAGGLFKGTVFGRANAVIKAVTAKLNALEISFTLLATISFIAEAFGNRMSAGTFLLLLCILSVIFTERALQYRNRDTTKPE